MLLLLILTSISAITFLFYWYITKNWNYWKSKNVLQMDPSFPFGSLPAFFTKSAAISDVLKEHALKSRGHSFYGIYFLRQPFLVITDPDLIKQITIKDFDYFVDRMSGTLKDLFFGGNTRTAKIWRQQLTNAEGEEWKLIRSTFSPIFTSGKMKGMMGLLQEKCGKLIQSMEIFASTNEDFELRTLYGKYSMDTIASCAFGVNAQSFENENSPFAMYAKNILTLDFKQMMKMLIAFFPMGNALMNFIGMSVFAEKETDFFYDIVISTLKHRRQSGKRRNDMIDLMLDAVKGELKIESEIENQFEKDARLKVSKHHDRELDELVIVANAIVLMVAGYETTSNLLSYASFELARHPDVQAKLRREIEDTNPSLDNQAFTYDQLQSMTYMDQVIHETLRLYPGSGFFERTATKNYQVPGHDLVIEKGTQIWVNKIAIHRNPKYFKAPNDFDPDLHFSKEAKASRHPYAYAGFGHGPRGCIGMRFALLEAKLALASIICKFSLIPSEKTVDPTLIDPTAFVAYPKNGLYIGLSKVEN